MDDERWQNRDIFDVLRDAARYYKLLGKDGEHELLTRAADEIARQRADLADCQVRIDDLRDALNRATMGDPRLFGGF